MTMRNLAGFILALALAACSSPNPNLYTLATRPGVVLHTRPSNVSLYAVSVPGYLNRAEIVRAATDYRLEVKDADRWGEPFGRMLDRVFADNLVQRLPNDTVFPESGAITVQPDIIVEVDIQRFDADAGNVVTLVAQVAMRHENSKVPVRAQTVRLTQQAAASDTPATVATMSDLLGQLADRVAQMLAG